MIEYNNLIVDSEFDSGRFTSKFNVAIKGKGYEDNNTNIQEIYNLTFEDFTNLEFLLGVTIKEFLNAKSKEFVSSNEKGGGKVYYEKWNHRKDI